MGILLVLASGLLPWAITGQARAWTFITATGYVLIAKAMFGTQTCLIMRFTNLHPTEHTLVNTTMGLKMRKDV